MIVNQCFEVELGAPRNTDYRLTPLGRWTSFLRGIDKNINTIQCTDLLGFRVNLSAHFESTCKPSYTQSHAPPSLTCFCFELFDSFFRACRQFASYSRKNYWESPICCSDWNVSPKHFFCPTTTYSELCSSDHVSLKILFLVGFSGLGVIYSEKQIWVRRSSPKLCNLFERRYAHIHA